MSRREPEADICLILEGAYPFIAGGVSSWVHDLIKSQPQFTFHIVALSADDSEKQLRFELPPNVIRMTEIALQQSERKVAGGLGGRTHDRRYGGAVNPTVQEWRARGLPAAGGGAATASPRCDACGADELRGCLRHFAAHVRRLGLWKLVSQVLLELALAGWRAVLGSPGRTAARPRLSHHLDRLCRAHDGKGRPGDRSTWPAHRARHLYQRAACGNRHGRLVGRQGSWLARYRGAAPRSPRRVDRSVHRLFAYLLRGV